MVFLHVTNLIIGTSLGQGSRLYTGGLGICVCLCRSRKPDGGKKHMWVLQKEGLSACHPKECSVSKSLGPALRWDGTVSKAKNSHLPFSLLVWCRAWSLARLSLSAFSGEPALPWVFATLSSYPGSHLLLAKKDGARQQPLSLKRLFSFLY